MWFRLFIHKIGALLKDMVTERANKGLRDLIALACVTGRVMKEGQEGTISVEQIRVTDTVRALPGEAIPVDGAAQRKTGSRPAFKRL